MKSMTGYGRAEGKVGGRSATIELRRVNHRFADVRMSVPRDWMALEVSLEKGIRKRVGRGRIECSIRAQGGATEIGVPELNIQVLDRYLAVIGEIAQRADIDNKPSLALLANAEGVVEFKAGPLDVESLQTNADELRTATQASLKK